MFPCYTIFPFFSLFLFSIFSPFPARILPNTLTKLTAGLQNTTWHNFARFVDVGKGSHVTGISNLKKYFQRFGYLPVGPNFTDTFDEDLQSAVTAYQKNLGLTITGELDSTTVTQIMSPRCGLADHTSTTFHVKKNFAFFPGQPRWDKPSPMTLTYAFSRINKLEHVSLAEIKAVFKRAFSRWSSVIPVNFTETDGEHVVDITIGFYSGDHGDGEPFDGVLGVLAHAFSPESGILHLDAAETWAVDFDVDKSKVAVDLESVVTHEIGHVLGLFHSSVKEAVMYPSLKPRTKKVDLRIDDVEGVQALYGSNPNFEYTSLLEAGNVSSWAVGPGRSRSLSTLVNVMVVVLSMLSFCLL